MSPRRSLAGLIVALLTASIPGAAQQTQSTAAGVITGRVIDGDTGAPIADAHLVGIAFRLPQTPRWSPPQTVSDASGRFELTGVPLDTDISFSASKEGYLGGRYGTARPDDHGRFANIGATGRVDDVTLRLWRGGTISGVVVDEQNRPVQRLRVRAWARPASPGRFSRVSGQHTDTSPEGRFAIGPLHPGDYLIAVDFTHLTRRPKPEDKTICQMNDVMTPFASLIVARRISDDRGELCVAMSQPIAPPAADAHGKPQSYETVFSPAGSDASLAVHVSVGAGEERGNTLLQLRVVPAVRVRGKAILPRDVQWKDQAQIDLRRVENEAFELIDAKGALDPDGTFTFIDVPPGRYRLRATNMAGMTPDGRLGDPIAFVAETDIDVPIAGLDDVELLMMPPVAVTGTIVYQGTKPRPSMTTVVLIPARSQLSAAGLGQTRNETLEILGVIPGQYHARPAAESTDWWLASIAVGGREHTVKPFDVPAGGLSDLVITMTDAPSPLSGSVFSANGAPVDEAAVLVFPSDPAGWTNAHELLPAFQRTRTAKGAYAFPHVVPGEYYVAAVDGREVDTWPSEAMLKALVARATRVRIESGKRLVLTLAVK